MTRMLRSGVPGVLAAGLFALVLLAPATTRAAEDMPVMTKFPPGESAPSFEATDKGGTLFTLEKAMAERPVLLVFWSIF